MFFFLSQKSIFAHGFFRIPGSNAIPGMPGFPGAPEPQGQQGKDGPKGEPGVKGQRGMTGTRGQKGNPKYGENGAPGMMGIKRDKGHEGSRGSSGPPGIKGVKGEQGSKGEKGEIVNSAVSQTNWKQCVWKNLNDGRDSGKIKVKKYLENSMKNDLSISANLSWPSLKETLRNAAKLKISINNSVHSFRLQKYKVIIKSFPVKLL